MTHKLPEQSGKVRRERSICRSIINNAAERAIQPLVIGRKHWLFSDTHKGARASQHLYRLVEAAKSPMLGMRHALERLPVGS
ncbi:transposase [Pseudomonas proteolytica]|nr:transposase [Pseudomonas proteolytica]